MKHAILAVNRDDMPFATAAKQYDVPRNTLKKEFYKRIEMRLRIRGYLKNTERTGAGTLWQIFPFNPNDGNNDEDLNVGENEANRIKAFEEHEDGQAATYDEANRSPSGGDFVEKQATAGRSCRDLAEMQAVADLAVQIWKFLDPVSEIWLKRRPSNIDFAVAGPSGVNQSSFAPKKRLNFEEEDEEHCICFYCNEPYSESRDNEGWLRNRLTKRVQDVKKTMIFVVNIVRNSGPGLATLPDLWGQSGHFVVSFSN
ncbi:hypothetical protein JTB14_038229 [Gonioctena quinquepunctata]|nr:hypothetical protein JTB14_038229 [Gonioctena quinquepunctata]